ncbi:Protein STE50 [Apiospora arundinis]
MNFDSGTAYAESDADDEYERSLHSPVLATDSEISPTDSEGRSSTEHTPTTYGHRSSADRLPETIITEWTAEECADFVATIGLEQYSDRFLENEIVGEALVALLHDDLKSMGVTSVGHRLTILKSVYDVKKAQDIPIESDHYVPQCNCRSRSSICDSYPERYQTSRGAAPSTRRKDEPRRARLAPSHRRLQALTRGHAAGFAAGQECPTTTAECERPGKPGLQLRVGHHISAGADALVHSIVRGGLKRQYSTKKIVLGTTPKNASPSYMQTTHERPSVEQTLDPASAAERAVLSSSHLAAMNGSGQATSPGYSPNIPSPTSPPTMGSTLGSRSYRSDQPTPSSRSTFAENDHIYNSGSASSKQPVAPRRMQTPAPDTPGSGSSSVEIFKSFRVSMDDPCYKVLPAALRKYQINAPWDQYALYIVYGDQERCLGLDEKPLILFKQLDKEGKKPMFMLRKTNTATADTDAPGSAGLSSTNARGVAYDPPGGII